MISVAVICFVQAAVLPVLGFLHEPSMLPLIPPSDINYYSYFGYSMAYEDRTLLVGAPAADKYGKIFEFNLTKDIETRDEIISPLKTDVKYVMAKHDWFGATIKNYRPGSFVICAPRKKLVCVNCQNNKMEISRGQCYIRYNNELKKWIQLADINEDERANIFNYGIDSFGWSVDVDDSHSIWIASSVIRKNAIKIYDERTTLARTKFLPFDNDELDNFGYSIVNGKFLSDTAWDHAVSTTYGDNGKGMVYIFTNSTLRSTLSGDDVCVGSMYGAALCKANLGDKRAALLVGAPTFADLDGYDQGAVYLYVPSYNEDKTKNFTLKRVIKGEKDAGYFGHAIASLGDMDGDDKDEVAISAPFEDGGKGAVYIYSGAGLLENRTWLQRIQREAQSFGFSLLPLPDYSDNALNGLSVGAPLKNAVYVFKPLPSITITVDAIFPNTKVIREDPSYIDFTIVVKIVYPKATKDISTNLAVNFHIEHPDAKFDHADTNNVINYKIALNKVERFNKTLRILTPSDGNYGVPISYSLSVDLVDKDNTSYEGRVLRGERSVTSKAGELWVSECKADVCQPNLSAEFFTKINTYILNDPPIYNCIGWWEAFTAASYYPTDKVVSPIVPAGYRVDTENGVEFFLLTTPKNDPYRVGSSDKEYFSLIVHNSGEPAYNSCAVVKAQGVMLLRAPAGCVLDSLRLLCRPTFPLRTTNEWNITNIELGMESLTSKKKDVNSFNIQYEIYNDCNSTDKTTATKSFGLHYDYGVHLMGITLPSEPVEITSSDLESVTRLQHHYTIMNNGKLIWKNLKCNIFLQKRNYLQYPKNIMIRRGPDTTECTIDEKKDSKDFNVQCDVGALLRNDVVEVFIDAEVAPSLLSMKHVTVPSQLTLILLDGESISKNITSTLVINTKSVPTWVIIISVLFALLILLLIGYILYKYNCFERKDKKKLEHLKSYKDKREGNDVAEDEDVILGVEPHTGSNGALDVEHNDCHNAEHNDDHSDAELISH